MKGVNNTAKIVKARVAASPSIRKYKLHVHGILCQHCGCVTVMDNQVGGMNTYLVVISYCKQNSDVCVLVKFTKLTKKFWTLLHNTCHGKTAVISFFFFNSHQQCCTRDHTEGWKILELQVTYRTKLKIWKLVFFLDELWFTLNRNMKSK